MSLSLVLCQRTDQLLVSQGTELHTRLTGLGDLPETLDFLLVKDGFSSGRVIPEVDKLEVPRSPELGLETQHMFDELRDLQTLEENFTLMNLAGNLTQRLDAIPDDGVLRSQVGIDE